MSSIASVHGRQILDSRGNPTVEVDVRLESGALGRAAVPRERRPASTKQSSFETKAKPTAARASRKPSRMSTAKLPRAVRGRDPFDQTGLDQTLIELDGTPNKGRPGRERDPRRLARDRQGRGGRGRRCALPLPRRRRRQHLPVPMLNVINGGAHAQNSIDLQEFMLVPAGAASFAEALQIGSEVFQALAARCCTSGVSRPESATKGASRPIWIRASRRSRWCSRRPSGLGGEKSVAMALDPASDRGLGAKARTGSRAGRLLRTR